MSVLLATSYMIRIASVGMLCWWSNQLSHAAVYVQTIARGIGFRFEDVRSLMYKEVRGTDSIELEQQQPLNQKHVSMFGQCASEDCCCC